jgi:hypothetical protein
MEKTQNILNINDIKKTYELVAHEKQTEIRLIDPHKKKPPKSIFVNNEKDFVEVCNTWNNVYNIYVGINERKENGKEAKDVISTKTIVIDIDPERETNTASTKKELEKAKQTAFNIEQEFVNRGFIRPAKAMSGNGIQLWFTFPKIIITDENRKEIEGKTKKFIHNIQNAFNSKEVKIDQIGDLPRIIKVMGTKSIKGISTTERPHRTTQWLYYNGRQEDTKFKEELLKLEPIKQEETIIGEKKESRSETEFGAVCAYIQKGLTKEQIFSKMMAFDKWAHAHHPNYKEHTYEKALKTVETELAKNKDTNDVPTLDLIDFNEYDEIFEGTHQHLESYKLIETELGLEGKEYYPIKKIMVYRIESLRQKTLSVPIGKEWTDNRLHVLFFGGAGTGKGNIKNIIRLNRNAVECSGARTNLEQLIGKIDKKQNEIPGYFRQDSLDVDECHTLIIEEDRNLAGIMREFRIAMDTYGKNTVDKKNVDAERFLSYNPETRFGFYSHDTILPPVFFDLGTARRLFAFELKPIEVDEDAAIKSLLLENQTDKMREYINRKDWSTSTKGFTPEGIQELIYWIKAWNKFCLLNTNQRIRILGKRMFFSGKQYFMRLSTILSLARNEPAVTDVTVKQACFDCFQFLLKTIEIYGNKSVLTLSRDIWKTSDVQEAMLFEWLHYKGAVSKNESVVMIKDVQEQIQDIFGVTSDRQAKCIYKRLKKNGFIHDYKGQHVSVCWLGFHPNVDEFVVFKDKTPLDLKVFLENEKKKLSEVTEVNSWGGLSHSVQPNISSSFYDNTQNNTNNFDKIELIMPPTPHTSNTSELKKNNFTMIDGELPSKICSECRKDGPVVAIRQGEYFCEGCFEKLSKQ